MRNEQHGPAHAAQALEEVVAQVTYKEGWHVRLAYINRPTEHYAGSQGLTLIIAATVPNSVVPGAMTSVEHWMAVPPTSWERPAWERWVLDQLIWVETHEAMEFFTVAGDKPYFPSHGPGRNPYEIDRSRDERARIVAWLRSDPADDSEGAEWYHIAASEIEGGAHVS